MARLTSEALSTRSAGLASILRDHKSMLGASHGRANAVSGMVEARGLQSGLVASSPESPLSEADIGVDEFDEFKEKDVWAAERGSCHSDLSRLLRIQHGHQNGHGPRLNKSSLNGSAENVAVGLGFANIDIDATTTTALRVKAKEMENAAMVGDVAAFGLPNGVVEVTSSCRQSERGPAVLGSVKKAGLSYNSNLQEDFVLPSHCPTVARMIPQHRRGKGKHSRRAHGERQSAPVQVPNWSKYIGKQKVKARTVMDDDDEEVGMDGEDDRLPPHELLAKEYARSQMTTFSVCEGQGRTLKGRDLSRVRDAVWSQMGFAD